MAPDLPSTRQGRPDNNSTRQGRPDNSGADGIAKRTFWMARALVVLASALAVTLAVGLPSQADDLEDKKAEVNQKIDQTKKQLNESSKELTQAVTTLERSQAQLANARQVLDKTRVELASAQQHDAEMAEKLSVAEAKLAKATKAVEAGQKRLKEQQRVVGQVVQVQYQKRTNMMGLAMLAENSSMRDLQTRVQYSTTIFDATESKMKKLEAIQRDLDAKKAERVKIEKEIRELREQAAANLQHKTNLEAQAQSEAASVASLVAANSDAKEAAAKAVAADKARYAELNDERIKKRIAEQKAAEAARIAKEKKEAAERAERERQQSKKNSSKKSGSKKNSGGGSSSGGSSGGGSNSGGGGLLMPVSAPITSAYGMRLHPVLGYWKLHDGTDFGAGCGVAIKAAASGTVTERYYNAGYGNRLLIDHGKIGGSHLTTAYNHAINYTVGVGQKVSKGETIGYVGTTGYSTGCHLHYMVYKNGNVTNPMNWY